MGSAKDPINIGILSLVCDKTINTQLIPMLKAPCTKLQFVQLKPTDLHVFSPPGDLHAVILLHPFTEGRLSLTDVTDARYSKLLPILSSHFGPHGVCVIAYLIQNLKESTERTHLNMVKHNQPTVFEMASCVILCGKLEDLFQRNIQKIQEFMKVNWEKRRTSPWQDQCFRNTTGEEFMEKQIQDPVCLNQKKYVEEEIERETRPAKDEDDEAGDTLFSTSSFMTEDETRESPPVVLVTDASGFIGSHVVHQLTKSGYKVRGTLDFKKGTPERDDALSEQLVKVGMIKALFPKLDLIYEAGVRHCFGWMEAVTGCTHVIHTSRFQDSRPATKDDITRLLQVCQTAGGIKRVVLTGGSDLISEEKLRNKEWMSINSALKDAICKDVSEKAVLEFIKSQTEKLTFELRIIKTPVVLGPILCELAEANVEIVRRRMVNSIKGAFDISIPVCDVRDVAEAHVKALEVKDTSDMNHVVVPQQFSLKEMAGILENEFKDKGYSFPSFKFRKLSTWKYSWDNMSQCLSDLYGNTSEVSWQKAILVPGNDQSDIEKSVIDMAYSCIEHGFIQKMPGYRPREEGKRNREETTDASVQGADIAAVDQRKDDVTEI